VQITLSLFCKFVRALSGFSKSFKVEGSTCKVGGDGCGAKGAAPLEGSGDMLPWEKFEILSAKISDFVHSGNSVCS